MSIQVGDLVEIVGYPGFGDGSKNIGNIGTVLRTCPVYTGCFDIEGSEWNPETGNRVSYSERALRKINPGNEACDQSFSELINDCNEVTA